MTSSAAAWSAFSAGATARRSPNRSARPRPRGGVKRCGHSTTARPGRRAARPAGFDSLASVELRTRLTNTLGTPARGHRAARSPHTRDAGPARRLRPARIHGAAKRRRRGTSLVTTVLTAWRDGDADRARPFRRLPLFGKSLSYTGSYTLDREVITHHTLVATWPFGAGSRQRRWATLTAGEGSADLLRLTGNPGSPVQFVLTWHRAPHRPDERNRLSPTQPPIHDDGWMGAPDS
ncbi:hypothetical protein CFP75_20600 [Amycolatopsis alba DSM 44262]|uniref:Uncharacterized protein n=1 Tax=Amycolatopsis alba DSM 44262 TaxID=1125972 RepID=A0A229RQV7_AMYAL|nr:lipocalin-like domain-containing protein [Amycolatopsis alba]OXM48861.1 hypothetical protein CFP75_20600 [Amycolatopsis alba DSM 44262]